MRSSRSGIRTTTKGSLAPMKKSTRLRPVLESLESMMLLSTAVAHVHALTKPAAHVAVVEAAPQTVSAEATTVALHGVIKGTGKINGTSLAVNGSGKLGKIGTATLKASGDLTNPPSSLTLSTKKGNLYLASSTTPLISGQNGSTTYTITGGTKLYADATGSGSATASYSLAKGNKITFTVHFS